MANEISYADPAGTAGLNIYARLRTPVNTFWDGSAFVAYNASNWATYAIALASAGGGLYLATMPAVAAGAYYLDAFRRAGVSPAPTDPLLGTTPYPMQWDGAAEVTLNAVGSVTGSVGSVAGAVTANAIRTGTAQGGSLTTITLDAGASPVSNTYQNCGVVLTGGTGSGQSGVVTFGGYNGTTKVCTMTTPWATAPDNTTTFAIVAQGAVVLGQIGGTPRTVTQDYLGTDSLTVTSASTGLAIGGATVTAYLASAFSSQGTGAPVIDGDTTDASGHWSLSLAPSSYTVVFSFGLESSQATFTVS